MKWLLYLISALALLLGIVSLAGYALPAQTTVSRSITLHQSPEAVFAVLADVGDFPHWNHNTEKVEVLPPENGKQVSRQTFRGGMTMKIVTTQSVPPRRLVRRLDDPDGPFTGSWTYDLTPVQGGCRIVLTEVAEFKNPLYRVLTRIFGSSK